MIHANDLVVTPGHGALPSRARVRSIIQTPLSVGASAVISGIAGVGHIILGVSLVMVLLKVKAAACASEAR